MREATTVPPPEIPSITVTTAAPQKLLAAQAGAVTTYYWRQATGALQAAIVVSHKEALLFPEERLLSWLRLKLAVTTPRGRWSPVLQRYESLVSG